MEPQLIEELIGRITADTRLDAGQARLVMGQAYGMIRAHADPAKVRKLNEALPGLDTLAADGLAGPASGGGVLGGMMRTFGGAYGASLSDAMAMGVELNARGITNGQLKKLLPIAMDFVKEKTGRDLLRETLESIPGVGVLLNGLEQAQRRSAAG